MNIDWFYNEELSPSDELVDTFADSKFSIDKWISFAREIIQNSLDAQDNLNAPVEVEFDLNKSLSLSDIPGGEYIKDVLTRCVDATTHMPTKGAYNIGLNILNKEKVYCLKISDRNTQGVKTGRDEAWGGLVFDEGKSYKLRPGSAGSHGVGKKVPFLISTCNTVFYATKNKYEVDGHFVSDCLMQGKTTLINWTDKNDVRRAKKGWFGVINESIDRKNKVLAIDEKSNGGINEYFLRKDDYGTDVIVVGVNVYDSVIEEKVKKSIINAILENFFVAILSNNLKVNVFGVEINQSNFNDVVDEYYSADAKNYNNLNDCLRVYESGCKKNIEIKDSNDNIIGTVDVYFDLGNENNKKYYTVVRSHGMRITEFLVSKANQPYTSVIIVNGLQLNKLLASLENAAHDQFITEDENMVIDPAAKSALKKLKKLVGEFISEETKIDDSEEQSINGLENIITLPGILSSVNRRKIQHKTKRRKHISDPDDTNKTSRKPKEKNDNARKGLFNGYELEPFFIKGNNEYILKFKTNKNLVNAELHINSINSEGKTDNSIGCFIDAIEYSGSRRKAVDGVVENLRFDKDEIVHIVVKLKKDVTYQLVADLYEKGLNKNK